MESQPQQKNGNSTMIIVAVVVIVLIAIGAYVLMNQGNGPANVTAVNQGDQTDESQTGVMTNTAPGETMPQPTGTTAANTPQGSEPNMPAMNEPASGTAAPAATESFTVTGQNFSFSPSEIKVKKGDTVNITFTNANGFHDFVLDAFNVRTPRIATGQSAQVSFVADKTGTFQYYCSVANHRAMGMVGNLIVE